MKTIYSSLVFVLTFFLLDSGVSLCPAAAKEVRSELESWLKAAVPQSAEESLKKWDTAGSDLFGKTIETMRSVSPPIQNYLQQCDALAWQELPFGQKLQLPQLPIQIYLNDSAAVKYLTNALRYYLALKLVQARLDDEALPLLDELTADDVKDNNLDLVGLLITKAVVCEHLALPEKGLAALSEFRSIEEQSQKAEDGIISVIPRRYIEMAKLLEFNLKKEQEEQEKKQMQNPQRISKQMDDVRRRLGKGKTDEDTQEAEKEVMKNLDKLIEKVEQQLQVQQDNQSEQGQQANKPADDSRRLQQKAPGNVDRKDFEKDRDWGDLPPKEREEALLKIEKDFPAHYRDIIEQYFREMAGRGEQ
ncbi:MAG: hypothetical protein FWE67_12395 [Planctomycetaceae bacterium]|nr:hypothetical protein [Planctomycetaceae bacterium]